MILREGGHFPIRAVEGIAFAEINSFHQPVRSIDDVHRPERELSDIAGVGERRTDLDEMRAGQPQGHGRPTFQPFHAAGGTVLRAEIVAMVAQRREEHFRAALRANQCVEALKGNAAVQDSAEEAVMIRRGSDAGHSWASQAAD